MEVIEVVLGCDDSNLLLDCGSGSIGKELKKINWGSALKFKKKVQFQKCKNTFFAISKMVKKN